MYFVYDHSWRLQQKLSQMQSMRENMSQIFETQQQLLEIYDEDRTDEQWIASVCSTPNCSFPVLNGDTRCCQYCRHGRHSPQCKHRALKAIQHQQYRIQANRQSRNARNVSSMVGRRVRRSFHNDDDRRYVGSGKSYSCKYCNQRFDNEHRLYLHQRMHHSPTNAVQLEFCYISQGFIL